MLEYNPVNPMSETEELKNQIKKQTNIIEGLEKVLKLNEQEISNAEQMVQVYETITEFSRQEMVNMKDSIQAREITSKMSADELKKAFSKIADLEHANQKLRAEQNKIKGS